MNTMASYRASNLAFQARWHRQLAADLLEVGKVDAAHDRLQRAEMIEHQLRGNRQCRYCARPLVDDESVSNGAGPECRRKLLTTILQ